MIVPKDVREVCRPCGLAANIVTCLAKYGELPLKYSYNISTMHTGTCDVCGNVTYVTEPRDFFHPDFTLLNQGRWQKAVARRGQARGI